MITGVAGLFNATVVPGVAVVCAALLASSGASLRQGVRWTATASATALAVSAWWLVPFLHGWNRLVRWEVPLRDILSADGEWQRVALAVLAAAAAWSARCRGRPPRRLALAAGTATLATVVADLFNYLRPERWLQMPILVAAIAAAALLARRSRETEPTRPAWMLVGAASMAVFAVVTVRVEFLPLGIWLAMRDRSEPAAWGGALAWAGVLLWVPLVANTSGGGLSDEASPSPMEAVADTGGPSAAGLVDLEWLYTARFGGKEVCPWGYPWDTTLQTDGRIRPLLGLYQETSAAAEFITLDTVLEDETRRHWPEAWKEAGRPPLVVRTQAQALGARWLAQCNEDGDLRVTELPPTVATGASLDLYRSDGRWARSAADWWIALVSQDRAAVPLGIEAPVPAFSAGSPDASRYRPDQPAAGLSVSQGPDSLRVVALQPGWAWVRVPWDPYWRTDGGSPVLKGGPGHLVVWAERGETVLRWRVPPVVDMAAAAVTGAALLVAAVLSAINRRQGWSIEADRHKPAARAVEGFADTVDGWILKVSRRARAAVGRR